jgi:hypothetical protein
MHKCKDFFGPDAHEFNPDRWIGPGAKEIDKYFMPVGLRRHPSYIPYIPSIHSFPPHIFVSPGRAELATNCF